MNIVALIGNLAAEPELRYTDNGKPVCTFRLAVSRPTSTDGADFFTVVAWGRQAEICKEYLTKGRRVGVDGRMHHSTWKTKEDELRSRVEVVAHRVDLLGGPRPATPPADRTASEAIESADLARDGQATSESVGADFALEGTADAFPDTAGDAIDTAREPIIHA